MQIIKIILSVGLIVTMFFYIACPNNEPYYLKEHIVVTGDTSWKIANKYNYANKDTRELIHYIEQDNNIKAGYLQIGQVIKIRIYGDELKK